jgi:hypothetical protein
MELGFKILYINYFKKYTDLTNKDKDTILKIGSLMVTNVLSKRYKENELIIKSNTEIDKNINL